MNRLGIGVALVAAGCATAATKDNSATARNDAADAAPAPPSADGGATLAAVDGAATAHAPPVSTFYPVAQGACPSARPVLVGKTPILHFPRAAWAMPAEGGPRLIAKQPRAHYDAFVGAVVGGDSRMAILGGLDEEHIWYTIGDYSGRGEDWTPLYLNGRELDLPRGANGRFAITRAIQQPDGEIWAFGRHGMYLDIPGDPKDGQLPQWRYDRWFAFRPDGTRITDRNLPMGDMDEAIRLDSGELVSPGVSNLDNPPVYAQLRRWSPTKKVNDLRAEETDASTPPEVRVGSLRAVLKAGKKNVFYNYVGEDKLVPSKLNGKPVSSWLVTSNDELWITSDDRAFVETSAGEVREEPLPERGTLSSERSTPWLMGASGVVYERTKETWRKLELPDGLWSDEKHPPVRTEWVAVLGDETWASTVRTDKGFGGKAPAEVRTFYASRPRAQKLRCGSPYEASMLDVLGEKPDAACRDRFVVLGRETNADGKVVIPYAKIAAALKADPALGESLTLGIGANGVYGLRAPTREAADVIARKLTKLTAHEPEIVCAAPGEPRTGTLDVKAGKWASMPASLDAGKP